MPSRRTSQKDSPAKLANRMKRRWRVVLMRSRGELLGFVDAADAQATELAAAAQFRLDGWQRRRLLGNEAVTPQTSRKASLERGLSSS